MASTALELRRRRIPAPHPAADRQLIARAINRKAFPSGTDGVSAGDAGSVTGTLSMTRLSGRQDQLSPVVAPVVAQAVAQCAQTIHGTDILPDASVDLPTDPALSHGV